MTSLTVFVGLDYHQAFVMNVGGTMLINRPYDNSAAVRPCGSVQLELAQDVGWDQWRFAAPAHRQFSKIFHGGPALEASWSHPTNAPI